MKKQLLSVSLAIAVLVIQPAVPAFAKEQSSIKTEQSCDTIETDTSITVNPQKTTAGTLSFVLNNGKSTESILPVAQSFRTSFMFYSKFSAIFCRSESFIPIADI
ncbi:hypothetical protein [Zhenpiania hominis]|uniref:hypothetical protein n=1 Tax=Zhenpiania hominis TaxID=2763644 RepID=UPI0039F5B93C